MKLRPPLEPLPADVRVSVVVPARNSAATLDAAVRSALQPPVHELVIAVQPEDRDTVEVARRLTDEFGSVRLVWSPTGRTPDGLNAAIRTTSGQVVIRVDAHAVLPAGYVARTVAVLRETGAANVGGRQVPVATRWFERGVAAAMTSRIGAGGAAHRRGTASGPAETVYLGGFRREALEHVGGYDPRMTRNQDAELNLRLLEAGYVVWFDPELAVDYRPRDSVRGLSRQYFDYGRWRRMTARLHPGTMQPRQLAPPLLVAGLAATTVLGSVTGRRTWGPAVFGTYLGSVLGVCAATVDDRSDVLGATIALSTMHLSWGVGFLVGPPRRPGLSADPFEMEHG